MSNKQTYKYHSYNDNQEDKKASLSVVVVVVWWSWCGGRGVLVVVWWSWCGGRGGYFPVCEDFERMFNNLFPTCAFYFIFLKPRLGRAQ